MEEKYCWLSKQTKKGYRLALCIGNKKQFNLKGLIIKNEDDVKKILDGSIVFVHLK